jgi:serine phosphatase RsbU (regulator of sigma subunit)
LAIGLDSGEKFNQIIKSESLKLSAGDNLLLFTDGVTEARNNNGEEYGENRLSQIIDKSKNLSAFEIKENILDDIMNFVGNYPLHDDLTFIVIKRN